MRPVQLTSVLLLTSILLSSCAGAGDLANNPVSSAALGSVVGGVIGQSTGVRNGAAKGALIGGASGLLVSVAYQASLTQRRQANARVQAAMGNSSIQKSMDARGLHYVAVPVNAQDENQIAPDYMKYDVENHRLAPAAYPPSQQKSEGDNVMSLGGDDAYLFRP